MSEADRYKYLLESAVQSAYQDEQEKLAQWAALGRLGVVAGKNLPRALPAAKRIAGKAAPRVLPALRGVGRWGQKQLYGLVGRAPGFGKAPTSEALKRIGVRGAGAPMAKGEATRKATEQAGKWHQRLARRVTGKSEKQQIADIAGKMRGEEEAGRELFRLTGGSLPGTVKAMATKPGQVMAKSFESMPTWEKAMLGGMSAYELAELRKLEELSPEERGGMIARKAVSVPLWLGTGGVAGFLPMMGAWTAGDVAAEEAGKAIGRAAEGNQPSNITPEQIQQLRQQLQAGK